MKTWQWLAVVLAVAIVGATSCGDEDDTAKYIAATCASRMTLAKDGHDSLSVLLACDEMRMMADVKQAAHNAATTAAVSATMSGFAAGTAAGRVR